jgi:hypothetical protein
MTNCETACPHYLNGKGSTPCLSCEKYKDSAIFKRGEMPLYYFPKTLLLDKGDLENFSTYAPYKTIIEHLSILPLRDATILIQRYMLRVTLQEIADYHGIHLNTVRKVLDRVKKG